MSELLRFTCQPILTRYNRIGLKSIEIRKSAEMRKNGKSLVTQKAKNEKSTNACIKTYYWKTCFTLLFIRLY